MSGLERLLGADEIAEALGLSRRYVLRLARAGVLPAYRMGQGGERTTWRFRVSEVEAWLHGRRQEGRQREETPEAVRRLRGRLWNAPPPGRTEA